jgi:DNA-binding Lrp family transcriptional regulator
VVERRRRQPGPLIDDVDIQLLRLLHGDARMSARALARAIGMSPNAVSERLDRLEGSGVIRGFHIDIDPAALGLPLEVLIGMQIAQGRPLSETVGALLSIPEVTTVQLVTGHWDLILTLRLRDQAHLLETLQDRIWMVPEFQHGETLVILGKFQTPASWLSASQADADNHVMPESSVVGRARPRLEPRKAAAAAAAAASSRRHRI